MYSGMTAAVISLADPLRTVFETRSQDANWAAVCGLREEGLREIVFGGCADESKEDSGQMQVIIIIGPGMADGL
jgi:hypothetical protein